MKKYAMLSIVSLILCFSLCFGVCATGIQPQDINFVTSDKSKISAELLSIIKSSDSESLIPVDIWFYETETEDIESMVKSAVGVNKAEIVEFVPTATGSYQIMVTVCRTSSKAIYYGLAWW